MKPKIYLSPPHIDKKEIDYVNQALISNWIAPFGPDILDFENAVQSYLDQGHFVTALSSGTSAIHLALKLLKVTKDDIVLCQSFTFVATANPITYLGAIPVFVDSEIETWNMCPIFLEEAIQNCIKLNKKPKAILFVDLYGMPAKIDEILDIAAKYNIPVIEDAAEALGSEYKNKKCGTFGDFSIFSFNGNKIITTSGGGALVSRQKKYKNKALFYATQSKDLALHYQHTEVGFNYRLSNICASIGKGQMEVLNTRVKQRQTNHQFYQKLFSDNKYISVFNNKNKDFKSNYWLTCILVNSNPKFNNLDLITYLVSNGIEARPLWKPLHLQPLFKNNVFYGNKVSSTLFQQGVCLPSGSNLSLQDKDFITKVITKFFNNLKYNV